MSKINPLRLIGISLLSGIFSIISGIGLGLLAANTVITGISGPGGFFVLAAAVLLMSVVSPTLAVIAYEKFIGNNVYDNYEIALYSATGVVLLGGTFWASSTGLVNAIGFNVFLIPFIIPGTASFIGLLLERKTEFF